MSLYEKKPVVVIDDNIYDLIGRFKELLCKKDFGHLNNNLLWF